MNDQAVASEPKAKPLIGIVATSSRGSIRSLTAMMKAVQEQGGVPVYLGNHINKRCREPLRDIHKIDALIMLSNDDDINPARYGETVVHRKTTPEDRTPEGAARAIYEEKLFNLALEQAMPVLGVCGGMQRMNVVLGGTLHQHLPDLVGHHGHAQHAFGIQSNEGVEPVRIKSGTQLAAITGRNNGALFSVDVENSFHHQAVNKIGEGLISSGWATDSYTDDATGETKQLIEAIEADPNGRYGKQCLIGVQWHPEYGVTQTSKNLIKHVVDQAQRFAYKDPKNPRLHSPLTAKNETEISFRGGVQHGQRTGVPAADKPVVRPDSHLAALLREIEQAQQGAGQSLP